MSFDILDLDKKMMSNSKLVTLMNLTILSDYKKFDSFQRNLNEQYKKVRNQKWIMKASLTLINAIITQNRKVFLLTKESLSNLLKDDTNHYKPISLRNYTHFIDYITNGMVSIKKIKRKVGHVMVCTVIEKSILNSLTSDLELQTKETLAFVHGEILEPENLSQVDQQTQIQQVIDRYITIKNTPIGPLKSSFKLPRKIKEITERYKK